MEQLELKCLKNKAEMIASLSYAEYVTLEVGKDINAILDKLNRLKRAVIFEDLFEVKSLAKDLREGIRNPLFGNVTYVDGFEELIINVNSATNKCSKAKLISM